MKKYEVKFYDIVYMEKVFEFEAENPNKAFEKAYRLHQSGMHDVSWEMVKTKEWKKPTVSLIKN